MSHFHKQSIPFSIQTKFNHKGSTSVLMCLIHSWQKSRLEDIPRISSITSCYTDFRKIAIFNFLLKIHANLKDYTDICF